MLTMLCRLKLGGPVFMLHRVYYHISVVVVIT